MLSQFKAKFNKFFSLLILPFEKLKIKPNHLTILSLLLSLLFFYLIINTNFFQAFILILLISLLDVLDGALARKTKTESRFGAYLDTIVDRYVEFIILFSFLFVTLPKIVFPSQVWISLAIFGSLITTYSKAAYAEKTRKTLKGGFFERGERMLLLILIVFVSTFNLKYLVYLLILFSLLTNLSALHRIILSLKLCTKK